MGTTCYNMAGDDITDFENAELERAWERRKAQMSEKKLDGILDSPIKSAEEKTYYYNRSKKFLYLTAASVAGGVGSALSGYPEGYFLAAAIGLPAAFIGFHCSTKASDCIDKIDRYERQK